MGQPSQAELVGPPGAPQAPLAGARSALVLLLLINMFNYIDRQVLAAVEPEITDELLNPDRSPGAAFWLGLRLWCTTVLPLALALMLPGIAVSRTRTYREARRLDQAIRRRYPDYLATLEPAGDRSVAAL